MDQKWLHELEHQLELDIWQPGVPSVREAHVMVQPEKKEEFLMALKAQGLDYSLRLGDVAR